MHAEGRIERRLDRRKNHRQIFRLTAGHDGVDSHLLHRARHQVRRNFTNDFLCISGRTLQHTEHTDWRRRHYGKTVRPATVVTSFNSIVDASHLYLSCFKRRVTETDGEDLWHARVDTLGSTARLVLGQAFAKAVFTADALPLTPVPADGSFLLLATFHPDQGRHRLYIETV